MVEKAGGRAKLVFVGGRNAPRGMVEGQVYLLPRRMVNFAWFVMAPDGAVVGKTVSITGRTASGAAALEGGEGLSAVTDTSIPFEYNIKLEMQFVGGPNAPGNIKVGTKRLMPLRYARNSWWKLVHPLPDSLKVAPAPVAESVIQEERSMPDDVFQRALAGGLGSQIGEASESVPLSDGLGELASVEHLVEREPVEISPELLKPEEEQESPLEAVEKPIQEETPPENPTRKRLMDLTVKDLRMLAKGQGMANFSQLKKGPLVDAIIAADKPTEPEGAPSDNESSEET